MLPQGSAFSIICCSKIGNNQKANISTANAIVPVIITATTNAMASDENQQFSAEDLREIVECEKIVGFAHEVMAGHHPRIKIPPHLVSVSQRFN